MANLTVVRPGTGSAQQARLAVGATLSENAVANAWSEGTTLSLDDAGLRDPGPRRPRPTLHGLGQFTPTELEGGTSGGFAAMPAQKSTQAQRRRCPSGAGLAAIPVS